eukprot:Em0017g762a
MLNPDSDIGRTCLVQHHIDIQGANPVKQPPRRLPFHPRQEVKRMLNDMLAQGVIEPATGPWSSPVVLSHSAGTLSEPDRGVPEAEASMSKITAPLNRLLEKGKQWQWTEQCLQAFTLLKTKLTSAPLLVYPNFEEAFIVDCDASDDGLDTVLSQNHQELHDAPTGGHLGVAKVLEKAQQRFYWVGQRLDVEEWCRTCTRCGAQKSPAKHRRAPMEVDTVTDGPMQRIAMDILGPLPLTPRSNKYILVIGDYFTKWTEAFPMSDMEAGTVAKLFVNEFVVRYGAPACLHTDQGRNFESNLVKEICRLLGIVKTRTTPYHSQSDGMIERFNRTLISMLKRATIDAERDWDLKLPCLMMAYSTSIHETTKATPFSVMFGREVQLPIDIMFGKPLGVTTTSTLEYARALEQRLVAAYEHVREHLGIEQRRHKQPYDRKVEGKPYKEGDSVWLYCPAVPQGHSKKLHACWKGPYTVAKVYEKGVYQIKWNLPPHKQQVVHFDRLKPYLTRHLDDELMPDEFGREEHSLDETTENEALIQDRNTDETTSENQYEEVLVEREDDTLVRQTEPDMLQGVEHGTESQLVETGDATDKDPENLVPEMDDNMESEEEVQGTPEAPEEEGLHRSTRERRPPERFGTWVTH